MFFLNPRPEQQHTKKNKRNFFACTFFFLLVYRAEVGDYRVVVVSVDAGGD